jgi:hypothetical protein
MSFVYKLVLAILAGGSVAVPLIVGLTSGWPTWLWCPLIVVLLTLTAMVGGRHHERDRWGKLYDPEWAEYPVSNIPLDSAKAEYKFLFSGTVCWSSICTDAGTSPDYQRELAVQEIRARARDVTVDHQPEDHVAVQNDLAVALLTPLAVNSGQPGQLQAWATNVALTIPEDDIAKLTELSEQCKKIKNWRQMETYLQRDVLTSLDRAVVWWLAQHTDKVEEAASVIGALKQLVGAVTTTDVPEQFHPDPATDFVNQFFPNPDDPQRAMFAYDLVKVIANHGVEHDCVKRLQEIADGGTVNDPILSEAPAQ